MRTNRSAPSSGHCRPDHRHHRQPRRRRAPPAGRASPTTPPPPTPGSSSSTPPASHGTSSPALRLLNTLPWTTTLSAADAAPEDLRLAPTPAVTLADRLGRTHLGEPWRQLLTEYDTAARAARAAHRRHLALGWRTPTAALDEPDHTLSASELGFDDY